MRIVLLSVSQILNRGYNLEQVPSLGGHTVFKKGDSTFPFLDHFDNQNKVLNVELVGDHYHFTNNGKTIKIPIDIAGRIND